MEGEEALLPCWPALGLTGRAGARGAARSPHAPIRIPVEMRQGSGAGVDEVISSGRTHRGQSLCSQSSATRRPQDFFRGPWRRAALARGTLTILELCVALGTGVGCIAGCTALRNGDAMGGRELLSCMAELDGMWQDLAVAATSWRPLGAGTRSISLEGGSQPASSAREMSC